MATRLALFMFKSATVEGLHAFAAERSGRQLPEKFAPWRSIGVVPSDRHPPHGLDRRAIEAGLATAGFQLWRKRKPAN